MTRLRVVGLWRYPIKSCAGEAVGEITLDRLGVVMDRRWMLVDREGRFIRQSSIPAMARVKVQVHKDGLTTRFGREDPPLHIPLTPSSALVPVEVRVWNSHCLAQDEGDLAADWFSRYLNTPCRLVSIGSQYRRPVNQKYGQAGDEVGFADAYPLTLALRESLDDLNRRIRQGGGEPVEIERFRPNILVEGLDEPSPIDPTIPAQNHLGDRMLTLPEDTWKTLTVRRAHGAETYRNAKHCPRCRITTLDPDTGAIRGKEPLRTLKTYRYLAPRADDPDREPKYLFCRNLIHDYRADGPPMGLKLGDILEAE